MPVLLRRVLLVGVIAVLAAPLPGHGASVTALLRDVGAAARFETPVAASGTLSYEAGDGADATETFALFARGATVRIEFADVRALVRHGKAVVARGIVQICSIETAVRSRSEAGPSAGM